MDKSVDITSSGTLLTVDPLKCDRVTDLSVLHSHAVLSAFRLHVLK